MFFSNRFEGLGLVLVVLTATACWPKKVTTEDSELDAITAASKRLFGNNVRGYMWALTTDSPSLFSQAPGVLSAGGQPVAWDPFAGSGTEPSSVPQPQAANASSVTPVAPFEGSKPLPVNRLDSVNSQLYQCWYYAETPVYKRLDGQDLRKLFLDKSKTKKVNNNFIDAMHLGAELEKAEILRQIESFALSALPGTCFLFSSVGPLKGTAKGALTNAFCSISLASISTVRKAPNDGWGSDKARLQIQKQLQARVNELEEVNWEVLMTLKKKVAEFNSTKRFEDVTQVQCPGNEAWVGELMGNR